LDKASDENVGSLTAPDQFDRVTEENTPPCCWRKIFIEHGQEIQGCLLQITAYSSLMKLGVADRKHEPVGEHAVCTWMCLQLLQ